MTGTGSRPASFRDHTILGLLFFLAAIGLYIGWREFWFLTDDAFISFRYISNSRLGYGYVWNPPPFRPVEGYTSLLWIALLDVIWRITGIEPPQSANVLALIFSYATLITAVIILYHLKWTPVTKPVRWCFISLLILYLLLNRTFLSWASSGLETAMFSFLVALWVLFATSGTHPSARAMLTSTAAALVALTRPDGLLICAATLVIVTIIVLKEPCSNVVRTVSVGLAPFGPVLVHLMWRHAKYGKWLPNTYYAKYVKPWPESGMIYAASFALEYAVWFVVFLLFVAARPAYRSAQLAGASPNRIVGTGTNREESRSTPAITIVVVITLLAEVAYYIFLIGGDHFEYRILNHMLPFIFIALVWAINLLCAKRWKALALAGAYVFLSLPVPWTHWVLSKNIGQGITQLSIASSWPGMVRWYAELFDKSQAWLGSRYVCFRQQQHKTFWLGQESSLPSRDDGARISGEGFPVYADGPVGVTSWKLPHVSIVDVTGLNDLVISSTPASSQGVRKLAHERRPPRGYVNSFRPNVLVDNGVHIVRREIPLTGEEIQQVERFWLSKPIFPSVELDELCDRDIRAQTLRISVNPLDSTAYARRGRAFSLCGLHDQAILNFTIALELDPNSAPAYSGRAGAYASKGEFRQAALDCTRAIELHAESLPAVCSSPP